MQENIGCRKPPLAATLVSQPDSALHGVRTAKQAFRSDMIAFGKRLSHTSTAHPLAINQHRRHDFHCKTIISTHFSQHRNIALPLVAEAKVISNNNVNWTHFVSQNPGDKI